MLKFPLNFFRLRRVTLYAYDFVENHNFQKHKHICCKPNIPRGNNTVISIEMYGRDSFEIFIKRTKRESQESTRILL